MARVVRVQGRGPHRVTAAPDMHLFLAVLGRRFTLIEPLQGPVMPLIELPGADDRDPLQLHGLHDNPEGLDGPLEHRGIGDIIGEAPVPEELRPRQGFGLPLGRQAHVSPAGKTVLQNPGLCPCRTSVRNKSPSLFLRVICSGYTYAKSNSQPALALQMASFLA